MAILLLGGYHVRRRAATILSLCFLSIVFLFFGRATAFHVGWTKTSHSLLLRSELRVKAPSSSSPPPSSFESFTVKELREMVKQVSLGQRGVLSKLKRKQDLVEFLQQQSQHDASQQNNSTDATTSTAKSPSLQPPPLSMPPVRKTLQDLLLDRVAERYPGAPLTTTPEPSHNMDRRQELHPLTSSRVTASDLDIVCVGTASCMPSATRGVSCTAVRVNWRRMGCCTWLFDVGESTQVRMNICMIASGSVRACVRSACGI